MAPTGIVRRVGRRLRREVLGGTGRGAVDGCDGAFISGWVTPAHATIAVFHGERWLMETVAALPRPDVAAAGAGPLECGYLIPLAAIINAIAALDDQGAAARLRLAGPHGDLPWAVDLRIGADDLVSASALGLARAHGA